MPEATDIDGDPLRGGEYLTRSMIFHACLIVPLRYQAPSEAEAQCAELARGGKVSAPISISTGPLLQPLTFL